MNYFDNAATTKPLDEVIDITNLYLVSKWYNPSSLYKPATDIQKDIQSARNTIAYSLNCLNNEIYFTSGGSESNNWVIQGFIHQCIKDNMKPVIITTHLEHNSIKLCIENMNKIFGIKSDGLLKGAGLLTVEYLSNDENGYVSLKDLHSLLKEYSKKISSRILVSVQFANNEIGTIQEIQDLVAISHSYGALFHTDAVQAYGHIPINIQYFGVDYLSASGHKFNAAKGTGFLYINNQSSKYLSPLIYGTQNNHSRGGTENIAGIMGMKVAVEHFQTNPYMKKNNVTVFRDNFKSMMSVFYSIRNECLEELHSAGIDFKLNGSAFNRLPYNLNITLNHNVTGESLIYLLDMENIFISSGSACDSHSNKPSFVLSAIGLTPSEAMRTIRITLNMETSRKDIHNLAIRLKRVIKLVEGDDNNV